MSDRLNKEAIYSSTKERDDSHIAEKRRHSMDNSEADESHAQIKAVKEEHHRRETLKESQGTEVKYGLTVRSSDVRKSTANDVSDRRRETASSKPNVYRETQAQETVYRDKSTGKKIDVKLERLERELEEQRKLAEQERQLEWGKGLVQKKEQELRQKQLEEMSEEPFAVYSNDERRSKELKEQERDGDPMADYFRKKKAEADAASGIPEQPKRPVYKGPPPPTNRFNIMPGYRWDGVDRSNGYEKRLIARNIEIQVMKTEAEKRDVNDI